MRFYLIALLLYLAGWLTALAYQLAWEKPRSRVIVHRRRSTPSRWEIYQAGLAIFFNSLRFATTCAPPCRDRHRGWQAVGV
jgi:hypothetical protein